MNINKHILMIMYGKSVGGAELQFIELANYLANNHKVRLVSLGGDGAFKSTKLDPSIEKLVYFYNGYLNTAKMLIIAFFANLGYESRYVVTTSFIANFLGWTLGLFRNCRLVSLQTVSKCMQHPFVDRFVLRRFDALIAGAVDIKNYLISHGQNSSQIHVVHNWVDFSKRKPSSSLLETRTKLNINDKLVIGCIGRFHLQKGQIYLVRAFAKVLLEFPNTILLLVGDGVTRKELEMTVSLLGLKNNIIFTGTASFDEYDNYLAVIDVYVQPSVFEGLPRTLLDAMFMGKAIVATDINGNREAIENEVNDLLVASEDEGELCGAITKMLSNPEAREKFSSKAAETARLLFNMDRQLARLERIIVNQYADERT